MPEPQLDVVNMEAGVDSFHEGDSCQFLVRDETGDRIVRVYFESIGVDDEGQPLVVVQWETMNMRMPLGE